MSVTNEPKPTTGGGLERSLWFDSDWIISHALNVKVKNQDSSVISLEQLKELLDDPSFSDNFYNSCSEILSKEDFEVMFNFAKNVIIELYDSSGDIKDILSRSDISSKMSDIIDNYKNTHNNSSNVGNENANASKPRKVAGWGNRFLTGYEAVDKQKQDFYQYSYMIPYGAGSMGTIGGLLEATLNGLIYACTGYSPFASM